jgi:HSP20 family protein
MTAVFYPSGRRLADQACTVTAARSFSRATSSTCRTPLRAHLEDAGKVAQRPWGAVEAEALGHDPALARVELVEKRRQSPRVERAEHPVVVVLGRRVGQAGNGGIWSPPVDVEETEDAWVVEADLPGVKHDDVDVQVRDSELIVTGEIKERERKGILRRRTRRTGQFEYRVTLPGETDADNVEASLDGGVLTVRIPKAARARPRHVEVKSH